jgi:polysaccharide export outer membrane protein
MRVKFAKTLAAALCLSAATFVWAQEQQGGSTPAPAQVGAAGSTGGVTEALGVVTDAGGIRRYQLGPGDVLDLRVYNEITVTGRYRVDDDGNLDIPLVGTVPARCRTDLEVKQDILTGLKKYLKAPSVSLSIAERNSRPMATVYGAVRAPTRAQMNRRVRLIELLAVAGGTTEAAGSDIQVYHTEPLLCPTVEEVAQMEAEKEKASADPLAVPYTTYKIEDMKLGKSDANPYVRPGDIVIVLEANPIFVTGFVRQPSNLYLKEQMSLTRAIAQVGGVAPGAKKDKVYIYRKKTGQLKPEVIVANLEAIQKQKADDIALQPYDIIEVRDSSPWSPGNLPRTLLGLATNGAQQMVTGGTVRIIN